MSSEPTIVDRMESLILQWETASNPQTVFLRCYLVDLLEAEWSNLSNEQRTARYADYCHVNEVLARTVDRVQDQVLEPAMPGMNLIDVLMGPLDELVVSRLITGWRETVWQSACRLLDTGAPDERASLQQQVEQDALKIARIVCPFDPAPVALDSAQ